MIVASMPRCGATKYCLDLSKEMNLPFVGELHPIHINLFKSDNRKRDCHETKYQPSYTKKQYIDAIINPAQHIVLYNQLPHTIINQADVVVLRKDMREAFRSTANFLFKMYPAMKANIVIEYLNMFYQSFYGMLVYLEKFPKPIVWFEEYFWQHKSTYDLLDKHIHKKAIDDSINTAMSHQDCMRLFEKVKANAKKS